MRKRNSHYKRRNQINSKRMIQTLESRMLLAAELTPVGTFETGLFDEGAAEIVSYDAQSKRAFYTNAGGNSLGILDVSDPTNPTAVDTIDLAPYGDGPNSVAISNGVVAVAVEADPKTDPGSVVFFNTDGQYIHSVIVGALPDMLTFTPDGQTLLVANEGEPDNGIDPAGSISIIDLSAGLNVATVRTADFNAFDHAFLTEGPATLADTSEESNPFLLPAGFTQNKLTDRFTLAADSDFAATFGNWDMPTFNPNNSDQIFIPFEVGSGAGLGRYDVATGDFVTAITGDNSGIFLTNRDQWNSDAAITSPATPDATLGDYGAFDPAQWTPNDTVVVAEEWSGNGRMFEWTNPLMAAGETPIVRWLPIPSVSHEGVKFDSDGTMYFVDENNSGSVYKYVPVDASDLAAGGQTFVLSVDAFSGDASANWNAAANDGQSRTGTATWVPITDTHGNALPGLSPYDYANRGGRSAADGVGGTPYGRPEDIEIGKLANGNTVLYVAVTSEALVLSIELDGGTPIVREFFNRAVTPDVLGNAPVGSGPGGTYGVQSPDNLAIDAWGNVYIVEDQNPGDIWKSVDTDGDGVAESVALWASLGPFGSEPTGLTFDPNNPHRAIVNVQHPGSGNDALWEINTVTGAQSLEAKGVRIFNETFAPLSQTATALNTVEDTSPFLLPAGFIQNKVTDRVTLSADSDFASTFGNWDMPAFNPDNSEQVFIPFEVGSGAGLGRYDGATGDFVTAITGDNSGLYSTDRDQWNLDAASINPASPNATLGDYGAFDPAEWTPNDTVVVGEEWSGNGRMFEWTNPLMAAGETPEVRWLPIPSVSHEGVKFDSDGTMYFVDENNSGSIYKYVPIDSSDLNAGGQTFVLSVDSFAGDASANWNAAANAGQSRTGAASWVPITDASGNALPGLDPYDYSSRGGRSAADAVGGTPYGRPEDLEIGELDNGNTAIYVSVTSEAIVLSVELDGDAPIVREFFNRSTTPDVLGNSPIGSAASYGVQSPDNLAIDAWGNLYIVEDQNPGDIWKAVDSDGDGIAENVALWASLGPFGSEPTGLTFDPNNPYRAIVNVQHPASGNDALWEIITTGAPSVDFEPEYIAVSPDGTQAFVSLQEANAFAVVDIAAGKVVEILPAGLKDHSLPGNGLDASDRDDAINIANWPVFGMYMPDAVASFEINGITYYASANEGDDRGEDVRIKDVTLDPTVFPDAASLQQNENLGRLGISSIDGDLDGDGDFDQLLSYGTRSFTIWDSNGNIVFDSGDQFEQITAATYPENFNASNDENDPEGRSDNKGPEPEAITTGVINGRTFAFIGLERIGGIMVYDVTDPTAPVFQQYVNNRDFSGDPEAGTAGDLGPEGLHFVSAAESPNGAPLLLVANEISGSVTVFQVSGSIFNDGVLELIGTNDNDQVHIYRRGRDTVEVRASFLSPSRERYDLDTIDTIRVSTLGGNDFVRASGSVTTHLIVDLGAGNDVARGGRGNDLLLGGPGNDILSGGLGNNLLIGGEDQDRLSGGSRGSNLLIGGTTAYDGDMTALELLLAEWSSDDEFDVRVDHLRNGTGALLSGTGIQLSADAGNQTVFDDDSRDQLRGQRRSRDWFFASLDRRRQDCDDDRGHGKDRKDKDREDKRSDDHDRNNQGWGPRTSDLVIGLSRFDELDLL